MQEESGGDAVPQDDLKKIEEGIEDAKQRIKTQRETLKTFSDQALRTFRLLLLFIAVPAAIIGGFSPETLLGGGDILLSDQCALSAPSGCLPLWSLTIPSAFLFMVAIGTNVSTVGFDARAVYDTSTPEDLVDALQDGQSFPSYKREILSDFIARIEHNNQIIAVKEGMLYAGKITTFLSIYGLMTAGFVMLSDSPLPFIGWLIAFLLYSSLVVMNLERMPADFLLADREIARKPLYDQERVQDFISEDAPGSSSEKREDREHTDTSK